MCHALAAFYDYRLRRMVVQRDYNFSPVIGIYNPYFIGRGKTLLARKSASRIDQSDKSRRNRHSNACVDKRRLPR